MGQLDLPPPFAGPCSPRKNIQYELRPVDDRALQRVFEPTKLCRRQFVVKNNDVDIGLGTQSSQRQNLPATDTGRRVWLGSFLQHPQRDTRTSGSCESRKLLK